MEVCHQHGEEGAVCVVNSVGYDIGVVDGYVRGFFEGDAVEPCGEREDSSLDIFELEIGAQHLAVYVVALHLEQMGVVCIVPGLEMEVLGLLGVIVGFVLSCVFFYFADIVFGYGLVCCEQLVHQSVDMTGVAGHAAFENEVGVAFLAHNLG